MLFGGGVSDGGLLYLDFSVGRAQVRGLIIRPLPLRNCVSRPISPPHPARR